MTDPVSRTDSNTERVLELAEEIVPALRNPSTVTLLAAAPTVMKIARKVLPVLIATASRHPLALTAGLAGVLLFSARRRRRRSYLY